jgi:hypothetical protein
MVITDEDIAYLSDIAPKFSPDNAYVVPDMVVMDGVLKKCTVPGTGASATFVNASVQDVIKAVVAMIKAPGNLVAMLLDLAPEYEVGEEYHEYDLVIKDGELQICVQADPVIFQPSTVQNAIARIRSSDVVSVNGKTGAVVLTGADIAVSGSDDTTIDAALADKASKADATLTPIYSDAPTFSGWTCKVDGRVVVPESITYDESGAWTFDLGPEDAPIQIPGDEYSTELTKSLFGSTFTATRTRTDIIGYILGSQDDKQIAAVDPLLFAQYYPEGNVKSAAEFTPGIKYDAPDTTNRTITVKPFCFTDITDGDNRDLAGRVVIPPFVDASGKGYISDDGTRYRVVGVSGTDSVDTGGLLTAIIAPNTVKIIGDNAFYQCQKLTSVSFPATTDIGTDIGSAFFDCNALSVVSLPSAKNIGMCGLGHCDVLTSVSIPAVTNVGEAAFSDCHALTSVDFGDTPRPSVPTLGNGAFSGVSTTCKIIVPDAQYDAWTAETLPDESSNPWYALVTAGYRFLKHSEWEYARKYELAAKLDKMEAIAWSDLKAKRDGGSLVPGQQYRITDYVATTNGDMESRSANHPFDIIVTADDEHTLNEHARAIMHDGDLPDDIVDGSTRTKYFAGCDLAAWDVWYCLDNDTTRFAWAVADGGKGVVYRLVDEFQNDVPYDFKGIQFKAYGDTDNVWRYTFDNGATSNNIDLSKLGLAQMVYKNTISPYSTGKWRLNRIVFKGTGCNNNTFGANCGSNTFGANCGNNTFGANCNNNTFGADCRSNTFGANCYNNTFGEFCNNNTFGANCDHNTFGEFCENNTFVANCGSNTFGANCGNNTFGANCNNNTFGADCDNNTFGANCDNNTFGADCDNNTFGANCDHNTFGANCYAGGWSYSIQRYVGSVIQYNNALRTVQKRYRASFSYSQTYLVGETLYYQSKYWECTTEHSGSWRAEHFTEIQLVGGILSAEEYVPLSYYRYIEFEDGVSFVALDCTADRGSGVYYQNVTVSKGIIGTESAPKHIEDANYDQQAKTTYQPADSQVISV